MSTREIRGSKPSPKNPHPTHPFTHSSPASTCPKGTTYTSLGHRPRKTQQHNPASCRDATHPLISPPKRRTDFPVRSLIKKTPLIRATPIPTNDRNRLHHHSTNHAPPGPFCPADPHAQTGAALCRGTFQRIPRPLASPSPSREHSLPHDSVRRAPSQLSRLLPFTIDRSSHPSTIAV